ncbi:hypothetical protein BRD13_04015 [Halobacteriales archaeon SW_5_70_135]|nr:MAG: hypothetical protein BRD13_04015 [Halobacteriales archaeon SW_5_70_135]
MAGEVSLFVAVVLLFGGGYGLHFGLQRRGPYGLVTETPTTEIRQLREPGLVELKGTARETDDHGTFESPIGRRSCVFAAWSVEEYQSSGKHSSWNTVASGVRSVPFAVDDDTGRVTVAPGDHVDAAGLLTGTGDAAASDGVTAGPVLAEFDSFPRVVETEAGEAPPPEVRRFVAGEGVVDEEPDAPLLDIGRSHGDRRYYERTIGPDDRVYVLGEATARNPDAVGSFRTEDLVVRPPESTMVVSNQREQALVRQLRLYKLGVVGGTVAVAAGLLLLGGYTPP